MKRSFHTCWVLLFATSATIAAAQESSPAPTRSVSEEAAYHASGVETSKRVCACERSHGLETTLHEPAALEFASDKPVTVGDILDQLHRQHGLSIRFDVPTFSALYGTGPSTTQHMNIGVGRTEDSPLSATTTGETLHPPKYIAPGSAAATSPDSPATTRPVSSRRTPEPVVRAQAPAAVAASEPPPGPTPAPAADESRKVSLPPYVIEPPDILEVNALKVVPKSPYKIESLDHLAIHVTGTPHDQPITGTYAVEPGGAVNLGSSYGRVKVEGQTLEEATQTIYRQLSRVLKEPQVSVTLAASAGLRQIAGQVRVALDGTVNLGTYGSVHVNGMTIEEAKKAIETHLSQFLEAPEVSVDVSNNASKVYYIVEQGAGPGDMLTRVQFTGRETVLDAIAQVGGLERDGSKRMWIARPAPGGVGCDQVLPINWQDITRSGSTASNYQLLPGDRLYIAGLPQNSASTSTPTTSTEPPVQPLPTAKPPAEASESHCNKETGCDAPETFQSYIDQALKTEVDVRRIDLQNVSVATALRVALEALPAADMDDDTSGLPIPLTDAALFDYLVEHDGVLITTRLQALTHKETRVYSVKHLKDFSANQLATVIRQSVRPWSWRSRIDEMGDQLRAGTAHIPAKTLGSVLKAGYQMAADATGVSLATDQSEDKSDAKKSAELSEAEQAEMLGNAVINSVVTLAHTTLTALEIAHYADPPTGSIQTLPGKLIITQSQAAHREIADLLKQLGEE